jgi:ketopantoate reductase
MSGNRRGDAEVEYILDTETWLGPYRHTPYERSSGRPSCSSLGPARARVRRPRPAQWSKLIFNATVNSVAALTDLPHDPHFAARSSRPTSATSSTT